jgi:hypothetical protein
MGRYLANPLAIGVPTSVTATQSGSNRPLWYTQSLPFGTLMYPTTTNPLSTVTGIGTGTGTLTINRSIFGGASSMGIRRAPAYTTVLAFDSPPRSAEVIRTDLQQLLARSTRLPSRGNLRVVMDGNVVVLRGAAATAQERRLAEALVRTTPGVRQVRNEITAPPEKKRGPLE